MPKNYQALPQFHGNLICAIDIETTGADVKLHDIIQLAVVPLDHNYEPLTTIPAFTSYMRPLRPENADPEATRVHNIDLDSLAVAPTAERVIDRWIEWVNRIELAFDRRLIMLAHNSAFEHRFLIKLLGDKLYYTLFNANTRDSLTLALGINDMAVQQGKAPPFERCNMGWLCNHFGIDNPKAHDAYHDAIACAKLYQALLKVDVIL